MTRDETESSGRRVAAQPSIFAWADANRKILIMAALVGMIIWGLTDVRSRARVDPQYPAAHKTDLIVYTEAGAAMFEGRDPYAITNIRGWHYIYPPLLAILLAPLSLVAPEWQGVIWFAMSLAMLWGCIAESRRIWGWLVSTGWAGEAALSGIRSVLLLAGLTVLFPTFDCLQRGQVDILLVYFLLLGFRVLIASRSWSGAFLAGVVFAFPVAVKVIPALPAGFLCFLLLGSAVFDNRAAVVRGRALGASLGAVLGLVLFVFLLPSIAVGPVANAKNLITFWTTVVLNEGGVSDGDLAVHTRRNQSLENAVYRLGNWTAYVFAGGPNDLAVDEPAGQGIKMPMDAPAVRPVLITAKAILLASLLVLGLVTARRQDMLLMAVIFSLSWLMMLVIAPVFRGHYYMLLWLPAWLVPAFHLRNGHRRLAFAFAIAAYALVSLHYTFLETAGRLGVLGLGATVWYLAAAVSVFRGHDLLQISDPAVEAKFDTSAPAS